MRFLFVPETENVVVHRIENFPTASRLAVVQDTRRCNLLRGVDNHLSESIIESPIL